MYILKGMFRKRCCVVYCIQLAGMPGLDVINLNSDPGVRTAHDLRLNTSLSLVGNPRNHRVGPGLGAGSPRQGPRRDSLAPQEGTWAGVGAVSWGTPPNPASLVFSFSSSWVPLETAPALRCKSCRQERNSVC